MKFSAAARSTDTGADASGSPAEGRDSSKPPSASPRRLGMRRGNIRCGKGRGSDEGNLASECPAKGDSTKSDLDKGGPARRGSGKKGPGKAISKGGIPLSLAAALTAMGIVYGDMGTSPVYTVKAIVAGQGGLANMTDDAVIGFLSLVFWSMTLIATVKYVLIATRADNHNEGGIFALYNLVRRHWKGLSVFAMIGGATFLADSVLTPAVSITSAVEGLRATPLLSGVGDQAQTAIVVLTVVIVSALFLAQHSGTSLIGRFFGPVMAVWFAFLAVMGVSHLVDNTSVLRALNPLEGISFLFSGSNIAGFAILGSIFLAVTGAEALYSDIGHVGRGNVYATWPIVKVALLLNYFGQGAWILENRDNVSLLAIDDINPFFEMMPDVVRPFGVLISIVAGIIASQALITGAFSLVAEAEGLFWLPRLPISYPGEAKGQVYIPSVNLILWAGTTFTIIFFQSSAAMEAAYGLALTVTMLATTALLFVYVWKEWNNLPLAVVLAVFFGVLESMFFLSSLVKFFDGGYVTVVMAMALFAVMAVYSIGSTLEHVNRNRIPISDVLPMYEALSKDESAPFVADNLVYLTADGDMKAIDCDLVASVLKDGGRRAHAYWVVTVTQTNAPYTCEYALDSFGTDYFFRVRIRLGYKMQQYLLQSYLHQIMVAQREAGVLEHHEAAYEPYIQMIEQANAERRQAGDGAGGMRTDRVAGSVRTDGAAGSGAAGPGGTATPCAAATPRAAETSEGHAAQTRQTKALRASADRGVGTVKYVLMSKEISPDSSLPERYRTIVRAHRFLQSHGNSPVRWFGLELTDPIVEKVILFRGENPGAPIKRVALRGQKL